MHTKNILCLWAANWAGLWQRHQQIMSRLAPSHRILYVESPKDLWSLIRGLFSRHIRISQLAGLRKVAENIYIFSPVVPFSLRRYPRLNRLYLSILLPYLKFLMKVLRLENPILWICYPPAEYFAGKMGEVFSCYDCCDDLTDIPPHMARIIQKQEASLLKKVKMVFVSSEPLLKEKSLNHSSVHLIPNGADYKHFSRGYLEDLPCPQELKDLNRPVVGFIGSIQHWVDTGLIARAAKNRPEWSWVLIGGVHTDISLLKELPNVYLLGERRYQEIPGYLRHLDVCLIPFRQKRIVYAADPIKAYEYLAAGKPVVSTRIPRLEMFGDVVRIAKDETDFVSQIERAIEDRSGKAVMARMEFARYHSWERRIEEILALWYSESDLEKIPLRNDNYIQIKKEPL